MRQPKRDGHAGVTNPRDRGERPSTRRASFFRSHRVSPPRGFDNGNREGGFLCTGQTRRPSDRHGPDTTSAPGPQCAFERSMINVSCNSHYFTQLAAFFIDPRAE